MSHPGSESPPQGWLNSLSPENHESALAEMRLISNRWDVWNAVYDKLKPPPGTISVGGQHIDAFAKCEALWEFNSAIGRGLHPKEAREAAYKIAEKVLASWNRSRKDYQVHRWVKGQESYLFDATRWMIRLAERIDGAKPVETVA